MQIIRRIRSICMLCLGILFLSQTLASASEQDQITKADQLIVEGKYNEALAILIPLTSSPEPTAHDAKGALERCYRSAKQWDNAISLIKSCIRSYPDNKTLWQTRLGRCYKEMGDNTNAITAFKNALDSTPRIPGMTQNLTEFLWQCYSQNNNWDDLISYYQSLLVKYPQDAAEWRYQLSRCYWNVGKYDETIAELEKALELVKGDSEAAKRIASELSAYYHTRGEFVKSDALFNKLNQEYPSCSSYWASCQANMLLHRGSSLQEKGAYADAIPLYQELIDRFARIPECKDLVENAYVYVVLCLTGLGDLDEAVTYVERVNHEQSDMQACELITRGMVSYSLKNYDAAADAFRQVISDFPNYMHIPLAQSFLTVALRGAGQTDEAVEVFRSSLAGESNPEQKASVLLNIANIYMEAKRFTDASGVLDQLCNIPGLSYESQVQAAHLLAYCHQKTGQ